MNEIDQIRELLLRVKRESDMLPDHSLARFYAEALDEIAVILDMEQA